MVTRVKFPEKAVFIYALEQLDENTPVVSAGLLSGTIAASASAYADTGTFQVTGTNTKFSTEVTPGCYIRLGNGTYVGQVASVTNDTLLTIKRSTIVSSMAAFSNKGFRTLLGPNNAMAALNMNFSIDLTTEAFQFTGDELDRDEITVITDKIGKFDFESFLPMAAGITTNLPYEAMFRACGFNTGALSAAEKGISPTNCVKISNSGKVNKFLTVEIHRSSPDDTVFDKVYRLSNVRGTVDLDITVGSKGKLKWNMQGNLQSISSSKKISPTSAEDLTLTTLKKSIAANINAETITNTSLVNLDSTQYKLSYSGGGAGAVGLSGQTIIITLDSDILTFTIGTTPITVATFISYLSNITSGMTVSALNTLLDTDDITGKFTGTISGKYDCRIDTTTASTTSANSVWFTPIPGSAGVTTASVSGTAASGFTLKSYSTTDISYVANDKTFCFDKLSVPNASGFEYTRYKTGCLDGWSKGATPTDVTLTILEDAAGALLNPHNNLGNNFTMWFGFDSGEGSVKINLDKLQLTNVTSSKVATFMGQDLTLRNIGNTSIYITGLTS